MNRCSVVASILGLCFFASCQKGSFISGQYSIDRIGHNTTIPIEHGFFLRRIVYLHTIILPAFIKSFQVENGIQGKGQMRFK